MTPERQPDFVDRHPNISGAALLVLVATVLKFFSVLLEMNSHVGPPGFPLP